MDWGSQRNLVCSDSASHWETISDSKLHLSSTIGNATTLCLDVDSSHTVVTNTCNCLSNSRICSPEGQWFKIITSARSQFYKNPKRSLS